MQQPTTRNDDFEALVNLLASDGVDEIDGIQSDRLTFQDRPHHNFRSSGSEGNKLDLKKIRAYYQERNPRARQSDTQGGSVKAESDIDHIEAPESASSNLSRSLSDSPPSVSGNHSDEDTADAPENSVAAASNLERSVNALTELEAKQRLTQICSYLGLSDPSPSVQARGSLYSTKEHPRSITEIQRSLEFIIRMDELVWRRSVHGANLSVFDAKNIDILAERISLWERVCRSHE